MTTDGTSRPYRMARAAVDSTDKHSGRRCLMGPRTATAEAGARFAGNSRSVTVVWQLLAECRRKPRMTFFDPCCTSRRPSEDGRLADQPLSFAPAGFASTSRRTLFMRDASSGISPYISNSRTAIRPIEDGPGAGSRGSPHSNRRHQLS